MLNSDDYSLAVLLSTSSASLDRSPKKNWVENAGELPPYIRKLARAIEKDGKTLSSAIAIAISRCKKWAAGGDDVDADTRAKATAAIASWEALKAKNKAGKLVKASRSDDNSQYLMLSHIPSFNTNIVRTAWEALQRAQRAAWEVEHPRVSSSYGMAEVAPANGDYYPYHWIKEVWTDFVLVEVESKDTMLFKIRYTVHPLTKAVTFGAAVPVATVYVEMDDELTATETSLLSTMIG